MIYCFYVGISLCLVILQTTILTYIPFPGSIYDLIIPFIIYLGLYRPVRDGLIMVFFLGFIMDNLSGSTFGLYLTTYCWLLIGVKWITTLIQVGNRVLLSLVVAMGVFIQNFIFMGTFAMQGADMKLPDGAFRIVFIQILWALGTGTLFLMFFRHSQQRLDSLMAGIFARSSDRGS